MELSIHLPILLQILRLIYKNKAHSHGYHTSLKKVQTTLGDKPFSLVLTQVLTS